jgi:DNA-binding FadR family transcriptional regulator
MDRRLPRRPQVYNALRQGQLDLRMKPGTPVVEKELCQQCGVWRTPAREALIRLRQRLHAQAGIRRFATPMETSSLLREDRRVEGVSSIIQNMTTSLMRIRRLTHPPSGDMQRAIAEHQIILDAMKRGCVDDAVANMTRHLSRVLTALTRVFGILSAVVFREDVGPSGYGKTNTLRTSARLAAADQRCKSVPWRSVNSGRSPSRTTNTNFNTVKRSNARSGQT